MPASPPTNWLRPARESPLRRIRYTHPATGVEHEFLTSEFTLPTGLIAFLYLRRSDLEKAFDELKNKLGAQRALGNSTVAQQMQAHLLCLAHNLIQLIERHLAAAHRSPTSPKKNAAPADSPPNSAWPKPAAPCGPPSSKSTSASHRRV